MIQWREVDMCKIIMMKKKGVIMTWISLLLVLVPVVKLETSNPMENHGTLFSTPCTDQNHLLLAPGVLTAGGSNRACVSRFYPEGPAHLTFSLVTEDGQTATTERELPAGDGGCVDMSVPLLPNTKADLVASVKYPDAKCTWERRVTLRIASGRVVVVHTERARYRPGETMRARVFAMKADLTPAHGTIEEIWVEGPPGAWEGTRVAQWTRVRSKLGLAQVQHEIDELAPPGKWTVRARLADGSQGSSSFWVGNYDLPPFQLSVRHAPQVLRTSERLVWTVCVRYPWTEAVEGMLVIRLRGAGSSSPGVRTAVRLRAPRACHRHAAAARRVGLNGDQPPSVVVADFSFQEEGTRVWQNTTVVSQVVDKPIFLEFLTKHRTVVMPGLPYKLKVKATRWDNKPATSERVRICRYPTRGENAVETNKPSCNSADTDAGGVARVMFAGEDDGSSFYRFEASLFNDTSIKSVPLTLATRRSKIQAALGPLRADRGSRTFVPLYLNLQNVTSPVTVHFVVITRGGIIYRWGATTQCPIASSTNHVQTAARNTKCNEAMSLTDINRSKRDKNSTNDRISDYFNQIVSRQLHLNKKQNVRNTINDKRNSNENNRNSVYFDRNKTNRNNDAIDRNMNQNRYNEYLSKYMSQNNKTSNFDKIDKSHSERNYINSSGDTVKNYNDDKVFETNDIHDFDYANTSTSDALLDRHLLRVMLPIKVTQQMCPDSNLIAYFYYNGEFVSASKHFEMDDCFVNKVDLTWQTRQTLPGSTTSIQISTPGPALCALTVLDSAAKTSPMVTVKDAIINGLQNMMDAHRNLTEYDTAGDCFLNVDNPELPTNSLELTATWLASAGVRTLGNMPLRRQCNMAAALTEERTVSRSDFSEAWLWRLVSVGSNASITTFAKAPDSISRFEANAVCLSKNGVSVAQPAILQVFREFFIHADSSRRLRRGDTTIIRYRLFNYLYEPLSVQVQILTDPHLKGPSDLVESVCVPPRASTARRVDISAIGEGQGRVIIRAKAVSDGGCGNKTNGRGVSDEVVIGITVEPEGVPVHEQKSTLLCGKDSSNSLSSKSEVDWSWSPTEAVPGTESLTVWAIGNITGPLLADADSLVLFPRGCGEQNMARLATNLLALSHLHPTCAAAANAREHVARGFTRQLQYIHPSGGFSAFGRSDAAPSTWLTAFSLRYLRRAHQVLWPGLPIPPAIDRAEQWLLGQQMENGCFRNQGQVFHRELRGGLNSEGEIASVALTAYVITSLIESTSPLPSRAVTNALACLRALPSQNYAPNRVYAHSLLAYAFMTLKRYEEDIKKSNEESWLVEKSLKDNEELLEAMELIKMGRREGEFLWWETSSLSTSIEATSYALLALRMSPPALQEFGAGAVRWLAAHRSVSGGFISTQDTLVALEALSSWSSLQPTPANLTVTTSSPEGSKTIDLTAGMMIPEVVKMGGDSVKISVEGTGCALIQATRSYNTLSPDQEQNGRLSLQLSVTTDGEFDCEVSGNCYCAAVIEACVVWSGQFPEMALLEISLPGGYEADAKLLYSQLHQPDSLVRRIELSASSSRATVYLAGRGSVARHTCVSVHAVGPRAETRAAHARLMDYYSPSVNDTQIYTIPEDCPARISHDSSLEIKDNIFNKARSLSDSSEILMNHDYTYEDIPEGIPLEDPLFDNLRREDTNSSEQISAQINTEPNKETDMEKKYSNKINKDVEAKSTNGLHVVINDKLALNEDSVDVDDSEVRVTDVEKQSDGGSHGNSDVFKDYNKSNEENPKKTEERYSETNEQINRVTESTKTSGDNEVEPHRIQVRDDQHENHKVDNPKLCDFHVIDSEKDLEVPSGIEGPIPAVVLPPPNFIPPSNYVRDPESYSTQNYAETLVKLDRNSQIEQTLQEEPMQIDPFLHEPVTQTYGSRSDSAIPQRIIDLPQTIVPPQDFVPFPHSLVPPPQNMVPPPQNLVPPPQNLVPPPQNVAPEEFRWQGYAIQGEYFTMPNYRRYHQNIATG